MRVWSYGIGQDTELNKRIPLVDHNIIFSPLQYVTGTSNHLPTSPKSNLPQLFVPPDRTHQVSGKTVTWTRHDIELGDQGFNSCSNMENGETNSGLQWIKSSKHLLH
jgi:hypothetical protein